MPAISCSSEHSFEIPSMGTLFGFGQAGVELFSLSLRWIKYI